MNIEISVCVIAPHNDSRHTFFDSLNYALDPNERNKLL